MPDIRYSPGDMVVLKSRSRGSIQPEGTGRIVAVLPDAEGSARYRVRLESEKFDRSIGRDDIDAAASSPGHLHGQGSAPRAPRSRWIDPDAVRTGK